MHMYSTLRRVAVALVAMAALLVVAAPAWGSYGFSSFEVHMTNEDGSPDTQAGSHPYAVTTEFVMNTTKAPTEFRGELTVPDENQRNMTIDMPAGFVGNPTAVATCPRPDLSKNECPADSQVGVVHLTLSDTTFVFTSYYTGVYNLATRDGEAADLAFQVQGVPIHMDMSVRSESDYGVQVKLLNVPDSLPFSAVKLTLWGTPGAPSHDAERGQTCENLGEAFKLCEPTEPGPPAGSGNAAFLTMPTSCGAPLVTTTSSDSWQHPETYVKASYTGEAMSGCNRLGFAPTIHVTPDNSSAGASTGLKVRISLPQNENGDQYATSALKALKIELPDGLAINPSGAAGRAACSDAQLGIGTSAPVSCPSASRIGTITIHTPLLDEPLKGGVFIGQPKPGDPYRLFFAPESSKHGVVVRLQASVIANSVTGHLTVELDDAPQLPVSDVAVEMEGGPHALLRNPTACGTAISTVEVTPWAAPGIAPAGSESSYTVSGQCGAKPFAPKLVAGSAEPQAGASSPFDLTVLRGDGEQQLGDVAVQLPPGLLGKISSVAQCPAAEAQAGACPAASEVGTVSVAAGAGGDPLWVPGGHAYLTGPYKGAPFGLSFVVPAIAGPFNLGNVVVQAGITVDPRTAQVAVSTDTLPPIVEGVPLELRRIAVSIDRPHFMVSPTRCTGSVIHARIDSRSGTAVDTSEPYNSVNCAKLAFKPKLTALTVAKVSRRDGTSLHVVVHAKPGQANIRKVVVRMPKQLPARESTLKRSCPAAVFAKSPGECDKEADVGTATVYTPILSSPMSGPVYLVSHGGSAYPEIVALLSGEGVNVQLHGLTHINGRLGVTRVTFKGLPDVPITRFDLVLPKGQDSAIGVAGSLCERPLKMRTKIVGQNGAELRHVTKVMVAGCAAGASHGRRRSGRGQGRHSKKAAS